MTIALIDGDLVVYRCAASAENESLDVAIERTESLLDNILLKTNATGYRFFLTGSGSFRKEIYPEYKANRTQPKPKWLQELRQYAIDKFGAEVTKDGLEADDLLAINQDKRGGGTVICSLDKDMLQVAGNHFQWEIQGGPEDKRWVKPDTFITQSKLEGLRLFYTQCLIGDSSDNIKGAPKVGKVKAPKMLETCSCEEEMFDIVKGAYPSDEEFLQNAQCLWLLKHPTDSYLKRFKELNEDFCKED